MDKKYELIPSDVKGLYRVKALRDFADVKKGYIGGYVESETNLSQSGDCWVYGAANVCDNAEVYGNAKVCDNAKVFGDAKVGGNAIVCGDVEVYNDVEINGNAVINKDSY